MCCHCFWFLVTGHLLTSSYIFLCLILDDDWERDNNDFVHVVDVDCDAGGVGVDHIVIWIVFPVHSSFTRHAFTAFTGF